MYHAEVVLPVEPGPLALITPEWIPGTHMPSGPAAEIAGVTFTANGKKLPWKRDEVNLYEFHLTVPEGVTELHAHLDAIVTSRVTDNMSVLEWERLLLYPAKIPVRDIAIQPSVTVPKGWGTGTALTPEGPVQAPVNTGVDEAQHTAEPGAVTTRYAVTNVEQLQDSPVITGRYFHEFPLAPEIHPKHFIDVVADHDGDQNLRPSTLAEINNLVREADAMYRSHHYNEYHFLLTLSDRAGGEGLEHGQSSDNGVGEKGFADDAHQLAESDLLAHEYTHSWNGKYRRPAGLYQTDFATPMIGELLWVYEGMTQYLGNVLAARSDLKSQAQYRDILALSAAQLDHKPGREWRPTDDTAISASLIRGGNQAWVNWRRSQDYYQEGELLWLDADTTIRKMTNNKKSLNDFVRIFLGKGGNTGPLIVTYNRDELIRDLNEVVKYDWGSFLHERIDEINPRADLRGIEQGGYKLVYTDKPNAAEVVFSKLGGRRGGGVDAWYSIGLRPSAEGVISDVLWGSPADKAKLAPGDKILAVDGNIFSADVLKDAIDEAKGKSEPIHLMIQRESYVIPADIDYHDGARYPRLVRTDGTPDYMDDITAPLTKHPETPGKSRDKSKDNDKGNNDSSGSEQ